jgi:protein phosphatase
MKVWSHTIKGRKPVNEDYLLHQDLGNGRYISLIADGMGGYSSGDVAARLVAENILALVSSQKHVDQSLIQIAINKANLALRQMRVRTGEKSGATVGGVYFEGHQAICFWVGDVKIIHLRNHELIFESWSHSIIEELKKKRILLEPEIIKKYRNVVTRAIQGDIVNPATDFYKADLTSGNNKFIIHSDGYSSLNVNKYLDIVGFAKEVKNISNNNKNNDDMTVSIIELTAAKKK